MRANWLGGTVLLLLAAKFAVLGVTPLCGGAYMQAAAGAEALSHHGHTTHGTHNPCAPAHQGSVPEHTPAGCLAMAGCTTAGIAALDTPELASPESSAERVTFSRALLVSVSTTPETPPPIA